MTLLSPLGGLAALAVLLPAAAVVYGRRRAESVRRSLGLPAPRRSLLRPGFALTGVALLGVAAAQPALSQSSGIRVRRDVETLFVLDTSRSMAAAASPSGPTRLDRAVAAAVRLRAAVPDVPAGVATLTDRVLPDLLPVPDVAGFDAVVERAVGIETPPPRVTATRATSFDALAGIPVGGYFDPGVKRRILVLLSDGESAAVDIAALARELHGYRLLALRLWQPGERVYDAGGRVEAAYIPDPTGPATLAETAAALGGRSVSSVGPAAAELRRLVGTGPTAVAAGTSHSSRPLAPFVALLGVLLLAGSALPTTFSPRLRSARS